MNIEEFVKDVLGQITRSVNKNSSGGDVVYNIDYQKGIDFDLAVTTVNTQTKESGVSGGIKVHVVGAEGIKSTKAEDTHQQTSRVQFNVNLRNESSAPRVIKSSSPTNFMLP